MVELLVVIGVLMVVIGLVLPSVGRAIESGRTTFDLGVIRSHAGLIEMFATDHADAYPSADALRCNAMIRWYQPLIDGEYLPDIAAADPHSYPRHGAVTFAFSQSLAADPLEFTPGFTRPCAVSPSAVVLRHLVAHPTAKGMMVKLFEREGRQILNGHVTDRFFCCSIVWPVPASFCDGSAEIGDYLDYSSGRYPVLNTQHGVGYPIFAPWGGYRARDR